MLILTRKSGESVVIGDDITVTVLSVKGNSVRIGVAAPKEVAVHREEVWLEMSGSVSVAKSGGAASAAGSKAVSAAPWFLGLVSSTHTCRSSPRLKAS